MEARTALIACRAEGRVFRLHSTATIGTKGCVTLRSATEAYLHAIAVATTTHVAAVVGVGPTTRAPLELPDTACRPEKNQWLAKAALERRTVLQPGVELVKCLEAALANCVRFPPVPACYLHRRIRSTDDQRVAGPPPHPWDRGRSQEASHNTFLHFLAFFGKRCTLGRSLGRDDLERAKVAVGHTPHRRKFTDSATSGARRPLPRHC